MSKPQELLLILLYLHFAFFFFCLSFLLTPSSTLAGVTWKNRVLEGISSAAPE